uniref:C2H2-type domain-containing protein n=1 Tax=Aegilops tauschii subsp. strangulata TaxID=200361 RepID=A0A453M9M9_AEGTS
STTLHSSVFRPNPSVPSATVPQSPTSHRLVSSSTHHRFTVRPSMTKHQRAAADQAVSLSLSLSLGAVAGLNKKMRRATAASGDQFVCKTCGRSFPSFQALGGHRTSHLRGRHGLTLALTAGGQCYSVKPKSTDQKPEHRCHICGQGFETGQALGGHMRRHRDEAAQAPPVLLELFV